MASGKAEIIFNHLPVVPCRITSRFGKRNTGIAGASTYHKGIDFGGDGKPSTPIYAVKRGIVTQNYYNKVRGWVLVIDHGEGWETLYQHLAFKSSARVGDFVESGVVIGIMGNTSDTLKIGKHLHLELHRDGTCIDFEPMLKNIREDSETMTEREIRAIITEEISKALAGQGDTPSAWASRTWENAKAEKITDGTRPQGYTTREQVITMIMRANGKD